MVKTAALILLLALPLSGCGVTFLGSLPCNVGPIRPDAGASTRWTREEKEQVTVLNEAGAKFCDWRP